MSKGEIDLNQIIAETSYKRIPDQYILKGVLITPANEIIEIDKETLKVFMNKRPDELTEDEMELLEDIIEHVSPDKFLVEINIHYDFERVKQEITEYVDEVINKTFYEN